MTTEVEAIDFTAHVCLRQRSCRANDPPAFTEKPGTLCPACNRHLQSVIKQFPQHWTVLHAAIGDHAPQGDRDRRVRVRSTRTAPIPINTGRDALAAALVELAEHAAALISDTLGRHPQSKDQYVGSRMPPGRRRDSARFRCNEYLWLLRAVRLIQPNLDVLATLTGDDDSWTMAWNADGDTIELKQVTGLQVIAAMERLHDKVRAELGETVLRHRYSLPCPYCGGQLGRLDGQTVITCEPRHGGCGAAWTEREYKWYVGLVAEGKEMELTKWLLAEAYCRLDRIQTVLDTMAASPELIHQPEAGPVILEQLAARIAGHERPADRAAAAAKTQVEQRDTVEQRWAWEGERVYRPPKRRKTRPAGPPAHPVSIESRSMITTDADYTGDETVDRSKLCKCNTIHAGDCG